MDTKEMLTKYRTVAVVGLSPDAGKPSHEVAAYLKRAGFRIIPVNPACQEVLGERCYPTLADVPGEVEIVDVFPAPSSCRRSWNRRSPRGPGWSGCRKAW